MNDNEKMNRFLATQEYMVIAVVGQDGSPWALPVKIQRQDGNQFEWDSRLDTLHSQALVDRPQMAVTMFEKDDDTQIGFYATGRGELIEDRGDGYGRYRFTAEQCWINDESFVKRPVDILV